MPSRPLRVVLDATAVPADRGGVGRYVDELIPALDAAGTRLVIACRVADESHYAGLAPAAAVAPVRIGGRAARLGWEQTGLPRLIARAHPDVVHSPHYTMPLATGVPVVVTVHDATFFSHPALHGQVKGRFFRTWSRLSLRRAARCVVPSRATRAELVRLAGGHAARINVALHGVDHTRFRVPTDAEKSAARKLLGLGAAPYIGFLGTLEPRKNVPALIAGWGAAVAGLADPPALVLAGGPGWDNRVEAAVAAVPAGLRLLRPGYLPLQQLPGYLGGATVVAYPSLGEGFGLPVLEAMACGAPVLTTRELALPEVGGDAVDYTEPDAAAIGTALRSLLGDPHRRAELAAAGPRRAAEFTWAACAEAHLRAYAAATR